jgi:hypothetical protein
MMNSITDSDNEIDFEIEGETTSEESSTKCRKVRESETNVVAR